MNKKVNAINALKNAEIRKGIEEPNLSHSNPVKNEPSIVEKLESIVIKPIAVPLF